MQESEKALIDLYLRSNFIKPPLSIFSKIMGEKSSYDYNFDVVEELKSEFQSIKIYKIKVKEYFLACSESNGSYAHFALSNEECICLQSEQGLEKLISKIKTVNSKSPDFLANLVFNSKLYSSHEMIVDFLQLEQILEEDLEQEMKEKVKGIVKPPFLFSKDIIRFYTVYSKNSLLEITAEFNSNNAETELKVINKTLIEQLF